jgi:hypothetical protein
VPAKQGGSDYAPGAGDAWAYHVIAFMTYPKEPGDRIVRIAGFVPFLAVLRSEPWEIADPLNAKEEKRVVSGRDFIVKELKRKGAQYDGQVEINAGGANADAWSRVFAQPNTKTLASWLRLSDANGKTLARGEGGSSTTYNGNRLEFAVWFRDIPEGAAPPTKLVWDVPAEVRELQVRFEFKDLPMPK